MILSASRRTDIPAFLGGWFLERLRAGSCLVPNPFNPKQVSRVSLVREDVDAFVFWTRYPTPFGEALDEVERRGYPFYFLFTITGYPEPLEPRVPPAEAQIDAFRKLSRRIGPNRVIWRYDPVILSNWTDAAFHRENFGRISSALEGFNRRVIVSPLSLYRKSHRALNALRDAGFSFAEDPLGPEPREVFAELAREAARHGMEIVSCASPEDLSPLGIAPGRCVDAEALNRLFGLALTHRKDPGQRPACACSVSRDVGTNGTCRFGCLYCYARPHQQFG